MLKLHNKSGVFMSAKIADNILYFNDKPIIKGINDGFSIAPIPAEHGAFLKVNFRFQTFEMPTSPVFIRDVGMFEPAI